jgi:hypothetical protein
MTGSQCGQLVVTPLAHGAWRVVDGAEQYRLAWLLAALADGLFQTECHSSLAAHTD